MADSSLLLWAVIPPGLFLLLYYRRIPAAPPLSHLLLFFIFGAISGFLALGLEEWVAHWQQIPRSFLGQALRQLVEVGLIEEGCKLAAVVIPTYHLQRRYRLRATTVFLFTMAVALGFTAEENWVYLFHGTASAFERSIGTPVHAMFSAPWGYAWAIYISSSIRLNRDRNLIPRAWLNSVICHALANILSSAWGYSPPLRFLSYGLFPFLLWMFWRLEQLLRKVQGKRPIPLISGYTLQQRYWQRGLVVFALLLSGNALFGLFILIRKLLPLRPSQLLYRDVSRFILLQLLVNLSLGVLGWLIYRYLRRSARRRYF
ncbi:PrsW family intramembrane metalloprotease [Cylindrospermum sp. FACHB-282]|uniref:PrsW family intramembrane metalloprotease n=1 Tax=Cylindrospermum sp. FACHB-282 TaxID=2692794 RepID=UPI0016872CE5|nr:PrsW family glutamic-type intramembrane protease [Cylindrospermum sp. FACHB-282]MBD2388323.1 PrsW family intramembrane metalloprotease [Cylindrospermum sp. FACHB-282]